MKILKTKNYQDMSRKAANIISAQIILNPESVLGLATGSSPIGVYEQLIDWNRKEDVDFSHIKTVNLDEYQGLQKSDEQSYYYFMQEHLFSSIDIKPENIHVPSGAGDIQENCDEYNKMLAENPIDIQLLGIGSNGHIGFNEPGTSFDAVTHKVDLKQSTIEDNARLFFDGKIDDVPKQAISMGIKNIMNAKSILILAFGKGKAEAVKGMIEGPVTTDLPASVLQNHDDVTVIIDKDAASLLTK